MKDEIKEIIDRIKNNSDARNQAIADLVMEYTILNDEIKTKRDLLSQLQLEYRKVKSDIWVELSEENFKTVKEKEEAYRQRKLSNKQYVQLSEEISKLENEISMLENELKVINSFLISQGGK